ncbi:MAG: hypothetical protein U0518_03320 [Candidatus Gracilibacteria bacterium]
MFRVNQTKCGTKVQVVHQKTGLVAQNPTILALRPNYGGAARIEIGESMHKDHFLKETRDAVHFVINGRGVSPGVFLEELIEGKK